MNSPQPLYDVFDAATKVNSPWALGAFGIAGVVAIIWILLSRETTGRFKLDKYVLAYKRPHDVVLPELEPAGGPKPKPQSQPAGQQDEVDIQRFRRRTVSHGEVRAIAPGPGIPWLAWVILGVAIVVPAGAWAFVATHSDLPYLFRVVVYDKIRGLIQNPHVVCGAPGCTEQGVIDSAAQFQLAPSQVPAGSSVTFYADSESSRGKQSVTLGKSRSVPVEVDIEPTLEAQPGATQPQPGKPAQPHGSLPAARSPGGDQSKGVDSFWLGDYQTEWRQVHEGNGPAVDQRWEVSIHEKTKVTMKLVRKPTGFSNAENTCNAAWTGVVSTGNPGTVSFQVSREKQGDYFCDISLPIALTATMQRTGEETFVVQSNFAPWKSVTLKLRKPPS